MTQTVKKSVHSANVEINPVSDVQEDEIPFVPEDTGSQETSLAVIPASPIDVVPFNAAKFAENLKKVQMWTSYTGPVPESLDDYVNLPIELKGMVIQHIRDIDEETAVVKQWTDVRFKTSEGKIISGSGKAIRQFATLLSDQLGQGDWVASIKVMVKRRKLASTTKDNEPKYMPTFEVIG